MGSCSIVALLQFDVEAERPQLLDQHIEGFGDAGLKIVVAADDRLIDLGAARDVIRFDRQHLLQSVCRAVGLERPNLHLAKPLAAELSLAAQRLLSDEAIGADRARMDLVINKVVQLHHIDITHRNLPIERLAGAAIDKGNLARGRQPRLFQHRHDVGFAGAIEDRASHRYAMREASGELDQLVRRKAGDLGAIRSLIHLAKNAAQRAVASTAPDRGQHVANTSAETGSGPAEMGFEDLTDIHSARDAERIKDDIDRSAVLEIRHVLARHDARDHALVAVTAGHLVPGLQLALYGNEGLDHFHHAG